MVGLGPTHRNRFGVLDRPRRVCPQAMVGLGPTYRNSFGALERLAACPQAMVGLVPTHRNRFGALETRHRNRNSVQGPCARWTQKVWFAYLFA
jgi:hypothetical protein